MGSDTYSSGSVFLSATKKLSGRGMLMMCSLNLSVIAFFTSVGDWVFTYLYRRRQWHPTPVLLPGESQGRGSLVAAVYGVAQSRTRLK